MSARDDKRTNELIAQLNRAKRFDDIAPQYAEALRLRRWTDYTPIVLAISFSVGLLVALREGVTWPALIATTLLVLTVALGYHRISRALRLDYAISGWKQVVNARAHARREIKQ